MEAMAMLPTPAAQENLARLLRGQLSVEARKCIFGSTYATIEELIEKLKRIYAPEKSVYQLQGELCNIFMWKRENVLSYAARIKEIADRIEDAHRLNNNDQVDNDFKQNLERDVIQHFISGLHPELENRVEEKDSLKEVINDTIDNERRLAANSALRRNRNTDYLKTKESTDNNKNNKTTRFNVALQNKTICSICKKPHHTTEKCFHSSKAQDVVLNNKQKKFLNPNQQRYSNFNDQRSNNNSNYTRNNYNNFPNKNFLRNKNYNFNNNNDHFLQNRINNYENNNNFL